MAELNRLLEFFSREIDAEERAGFPRLSRVPDSHVASHPSSQFCFERALGFGFGDWDYIVEENVDEAMRLFADLVRYCIALPFRIRAEAA